MKQMGKHSGLTYCQCPHCEKWDRHYLLGYVGEKLAIKCGLCGKVFKTDKEEL